MQQPGTPSRAYTPGRYSGIEGSVHGFDLMVADRYAGDGVVTRVERVTKSASAAAARGGPTAGAKADAAD